MLTHEAFQYLTMIRRTKVVNGHVMEYYEDPSDDADDCGVRSKEGNQRAPEGGGTRGRIFGAGGKRAEVREGKTEGAAESINSYMGLPCNY